VALFRRKATPAPAPTGPTEPTELTGPTTERLPQDVVTVMEGFGRYTFHPMHACHAGVDAWESYLAPLWRFARDDPDGFCAALATRVLPRGGWAVYGSAHAVVELTDRSGDNAHHRALMDASLQFLRSNGVPMTQLTGYEKAHWNQRAGAFESWLAPRVPPQPEAAPITPLLSREVRRVVQLEDRDDANLFLVERGPDGRHTALIDARWSDEDPRRVRSAWTSEDTLHQLYVEIGWSLQVPPHWQDPELAPYIPYARPGIS
jgi:hypothetical protein